MSAPGTPVPPYRPAPGAPRVSQSSGPTPRTCRSRLPFSFAVLQWLAPCRVRCSVCLGQTAEKRSPRGLGLAGSRTGPKRLEGTRSSDRWPDPAAPRLREAPSAPEPASPRPGGPGPAPPAHADPPAARAGSQGSRWRMPERRRDPGRLGRPSGLTSRREQVRPSGDGGGVARAPGRVSFLSVLAIRVRGASQRLRDFAGRAGQHGEMRSTPGCRPGPRWCCGCPSWTCSPR